MKYKHHFTRRRLLLYILAIWVCTCLLQIYKFYEWNLSAGKCFPVKVPYGVQDTQALIIIYSVVSFYIPCFIARATFAHIALLFKTSPMARCYGKRERAQQKALLRLTDDVSCANPVFVSKSSHLSSFPFWHHQDRQLFA